MVRAWQRSRAVASLLVLLWLLPLVAGAAAQAGAGAGGRGPSIEPERLRVHEMNRLNPAGGAASRAARGAAPGEDSAWWRPHHPPRVLRTASPRQVGMLPSYLEQIDEAVRSGLEADMFPGAVVMVVKDGRIVKHDAYGYAVRYATDSELLPERAWVPMRPDTIFDLASVTKLFTSIAVLQLAEEGRVDLDAPVARYVPEFAAGGKEAVTVRQLLTHTSGLPAWLPLYQLPGTPPDRLQAVFQVQLQDPPGTVYRYSDLGLIVLGVLVERVSGLPLDRFVAERITGPLGMSETMFNPPAALRERIAATEYQPWTGRGMVWGSVHDENAYSLGGVAGHAGLFSTARDLAVLAQALLNGGHYGKARILRPETVREMLTNQLPGFPGNDHGLGWELNQGWYMDALASPVTAGHTGYTGTSLVIDPRSDTVVIFLTNRVHPTRNAGSINPWRRDVARLVARALPVRPFSGRWAWFAGMGDGIEHTLSREVYLEGGGRLRFRTWFDIEPGFDFGYVEASRDGGRTWEPLRGHLMVPAAGAGRGRGQGQRAIPIEGALTGSSGGAWREVELDLSAFSGPVTLRFRYATDAAVNGRGWYIDELVVTDRRGVVLRDGAERAGGWDAAGWQRSPD